MRKRTTLLLLPLLCHIDIIPQQKSHKKIQKTPQEKYNDFLESNNFYAFYPEDLTQEKQSIARSKPSLYSQYNNLPVPVQDQITSYLQVTHFTPLNSEVSNELTLIKTPEHQALVVKNCQNNLQCYLDLLSSSNRDKYAIKNIKNCLRVEYWNRYFAYAQRQNVTTDKYMPPSPICDSALPACNNYFNDICADILYPEDSLEIAALMIACGILIHHDNKPIKKTPLYYPLQNDALPMVQLLMKSGITSTSGRHKSHRKSLKAAPLIIFAAQCNAIKTIKYLHYLGHDLNEKDSQGYSALDRAYLFERRQAIDVLLSLGAHPDTTNCADKKIFCM